MIRRLTNLFPLWAVLFSVLAYFFPELWRPYKSAIVPLLGLVMLGMGLTLTARDFQNVLRFPRPLLIGVLLQFLLMPLLAFVIARTADLPPELLAGMVILGSAPGGTASNVICYLARANVALSIAMTLASTMLSFLATPLLTWTYIGQSVAVPVGKMTATILKIIVLPVLAGMTVNSLFGARLKKVKDISPLVSVGAIVVIIAIIVALNAEQIGRAGPLLLGCVAMHNILGLSCGYAAARLLRLSVHDARTVAIEIGMQNSGLGVALALKYFSTLAALPSALFSIWHNLCGACLARYWANKPDQPTPEVA